MRKLFVLCLALCFVFALTAMAFDDMGKSATVNGWVADDKCGAKGANAGAEACTKKCLAAGAKMVIVTETWRWLFRALSGQSLPNSCYPIPSHHT